MTDRWAATLPPVSSLEAARLWTRRGMEVCAAADRLWLRGNEWDEELDRSLRSLLGCERFHAFADGSLVPVGRSVPSGTLPEGPWSPLDDWFKLAAPPKGFPATVPPRSSLRLVRSTQEREINLLLVCFADWYEYAIRAPLVRLDRLSFAASDDGHVLVRGAPAPPLQGTGLVEEYGIACPAGWTWSPGLDAEVIRRAWQLDQGDVAVLAADGTREIVSGDTFVRATRSAVRLTERGLHGGGE